MSLGKSIISAPTFVEDVFAEVAGVENVFGDYERKKRDALVKSMTKDIDKLHESQRAYENDFRGSIASGNFLDAGSIGFNTVVESAPIMVASTAAAILSGGSSVVAQGLTSAGVMSALLIPGEYTESVFSEDEKVKDISLHSTGTDTYLISCNKAEEDKGAGIILDNYFWHIFAKGRNWHRAAYFDVKDCK